MGLCLYMFLYGRTPIILSKNIFVNHRSYSNNYHQDYQQFTYNYKHLSLSLSLQLWKEFFLDHSKKYMVSTMPKCDSMQGFAS